jgi:hypothetical protein
MLIVSFFHPGKNIQNFPKPIECLKRQYFYEFKILFLCILHWFCLKKHMLLKIFNPANHNHYHHPLVFFLSEVPL